MVVLSGSSCNYTDKRGDIILINIIPNDTNCMQIDEITGILLNNS